jgi:hypothetical protein
MSGEPPRGGPHRFVPWVPTLLLLAPFVVFLRHHSYALTRPEILACLTLIGLVGVAMAAIIRRWPGVAGTLTASCLILAIDVQFSFDAPIEGLGKTTILILATPVAAALLSLSAARAVSFVGLMAATVAATTMILPAGRLTVEVSGDTQTASLQPLLVHLILDEHIGPRGLRVAQEPEAARELQRFLERRGFLVFDSAYSESGETVQSIGHTLDLQSGSSDPTLVEPASAPFAGRLTRSRYLAGLAKKGYSLRIYQPDHLDLCTAAPVAACHTYASTKLGVLQHTSLSKMDRAVVIAGAYLMRSDLWTEVRELYNTMQVRHAPSLPSWTWEQTRVSTIAAMLMSTRLETDLRRASRGQMILAHLLLPHFPYIYDAGCEIRSPLQWLERNDTRFFPHRNTPEGRALRYERYVQQLACTRVRLDALMSAIPPDLRHDAIVVVHGDHGSRISIGGPTPPATDSSDTFSTLFAVRGPGIVPGLDTRPLAVSCLLAEFAARDFNEPPSREACSTPPALHDMSQGRSGSPPVALE